MIRSALEHGSLIDIALVSDLAAVDGRRMFEHKQAPWGHRTGGSVGMERGERRLKSRKDFRFAQALRRSGVEPDQCADFGAVVARDHRVLHERVARGDQPYANRARVDPSTRL